MAELETKEVVICTSTVLKRILQEELLSMSNINVFIVDSCHLIYKDEDLKYIMRIYKECPQNNRPIILALTYPLFNSKKDTEDKKETEHNEKEKEETISIREKETADDLTTPSSDGASETERRVFERAKGTEVEEIGVYKNLDDFDMYEKLEWKIEELEKELCCQMDLAEDIDGGKRMSASVSKPRELIIEYDGKRTDEQLSDIYKDLDKYMRDTVQDALDFIEDHRHDPTEIYGEELYDEFMSIPDPTIDPKMVFKKFLYVLEQLGPYAADKAAFCLLNKLEKLKIKIPYERHFILMCLCTTVFIKIRCYAELVFNTIEDEWTRIKTFSTPKILRFVEILEKFKPPDTKNPTTIRPDSDSSPTIRPDSDSSATIRPDCDSRDTKEETDSTCDIPKSKEDNVKKMLKDIEGCDFNTLGNKIQDKVHIYETNLKEITEIKTDSEEKSDTSPDSPKTESNKESDDPKSDYPDDKPDSQADSQPDTKIGMDSKGNEFLFQQRGLLGFTRRAGNRLRGKSRMQRNNAARALQMQQNPDALCGIVFMKEPLIAKIMFMVIVDMARCNPGLSYVCVQFCATESPADPETEPRECLRQGKKQEEVLKKFRMHECNLLLATSALEEGIDLPRCNLVLRWDVPPSYRSYGLCRGRARAPRSAAALLCSDSPDTTDMLLHNVATYRELDQIISRKCGCGIQDEPPQSEEDHADAFTNFVKPYSPNDSKKAEENTSKVSDTVATNDVDANDTAAMNDIDALQKKGNLPMNDMVPIEINDTLPMNDAVATEVNDKNICENNVSIKQIDVNNDIVELNDKFGDLLKIDGDYKDGVLPKLGDVDKELTSQNNETGEIELKTEFKNENDRKIAENNVKKDEKRLKDKDKSSKDKKDIPKDTLSKGYCNKCFNTKLNGVCLCSNVNLYYQLLNKASFANRGDYKKPQNEADSFASVDLSTAIALINRYCGKLPSDTFTRLAPQWWMEEVALPVKGTGQVKPAYICTLRLPLNCPVKYNIVGHPMSTKVLARRMVALQACRILHKSGELDNQLMPIGKENFRAVELEGVNTIGTCAGNEPADAHDSARPGTTKRRQYYYKRTAWAFTDCQPVIDSTDAEIYPDVDPDTLDIDSDVEAPNPSDDEKVSSKHKEPKKDSGKRNMLYAIVSKLWCALPERYNTRGRRLHAPQLASQAIGILMARQEPDSLQIPAFPVYTRSGEVRVSVEHVPGADVRISPRRAKLIRRFMRFVFAEVLRVRRRGMKLQSEGSTHNNYYIVPTLKTVSEDGTHKIDIDWDFLELIYQHTEEKKASDLEKPVLWQEMPDEEKVEKDSNRRRRGKKRMANPLLKQGDTFVFDAEKYKEAVVTPWYRNQDQPQFFLVAEICWNLTPDSSFPSATHQSFSDYYSTKYGVTLTQRDQPLLDVDHTSARLNLLTPRYVNRKGVALPVSSERTRRAKRDRLDQKQILIPELCRVHPFAAPLWFATVALPCVLYRINALLIADEIRRAVAIDVGLGIPKINEQTMPGFQWPALDFGWSLAEVLSADSEKIDKKKDEEESKKELKEIKDNESSEKEKTEAEGSQKSTDEDKPLEDGTPEKTINDILQEKEDAEADAAFEIGTWSNDMASSIPETSECDELMEPLPPNLTFCTSASGGSNWCDPIGKPKYNQYGGSKNFSMADSDDSFMSSDLDSDDTDLDYEGSDEDADANGFCSSRNANTTMGVRIEYKTAHEAEAFDIERTKKVNPAPMPDEEDDARDRAQHDELIRQGSAPEEHKQDIIDKHQLITKEDDITEILPETKETYHSSIICNKTERQAIDELFPFGTEELEIKNGQIDIESIERNKRVLLERIKKNLPNYQVKKLNCFSMKDINIDSKDYVNEKLVNVGFDTKDGYQSVSKGDGEFVPYYTDGRGGKDFDFDFQPVLEGHPGPSPSVILQVSNLNLYRLGRNKRLGARMIASKFEPHDNWLPPCHKPPPTLHPRLNVSNFLTILLSS
ncbi:hypothetical protein HF086_001869 [Spodoptera exigua]|uniref:Dicer-1 n=2 Tax=Spodoptera exigua TaxID=7107 RepID=A0A922M6V2_SPOEX|nr:hypothetical protein HF086_001869 [Spodoptera exigua]